MTHAPNQFEDELEADREARRRELEKKRKPPRRKPLVNPNLPAEGGGDGV